MQIQVLAVLLPLLFAASAASADIFVCDGDPPVYQDVPCGSSAISSGEASAGAGVRESERRWLESRRQSGSAVATQPAASDGAAADRRQQQQCWKTRQRLDEVRAKLRRGYKPAQGERLRRQRRRHEDYLFRYCD